MSAIASKCFEVRKYFGPKRIAFAPEREVFGRCGPLWVGGGRSEGYAQQSRRL